MALFPGAQHMLIPESASQVRIRPTIVLIHTHVGNPSLKGAHATMTAPKADKEYHFNLRIGGTELAQYVDTETRADNNFQANEFSVGGVRCGAISIETGDLGAPNGPDPQLKKSFSDLGEFDVLVDLVEWCCRTHGIPAERCPSPFEPGVGYHSMWGFNQRGPGQGTFGRYDVPEDFGGGTARLNNPWTPALGKTCPGKGKIDEFDRVLTTVRQRLGQAPSGRGRVVPAIGTRADFVGPATVSAQNAQMWALDQGAPAEIIAEVVPLYWELAPALELRPEVPFAQAMIETANFKFPRCGKTVCPDFCNPCGMRTHDLDPKDGETPENHQRFASWRDGISAHLDHLALYLGRPGYPRADTHDPRHFPRLFDKVVSLTNLGDEWVLGGGGENPDYGEKIRTRVMRMGGVTQGGGLDHPSLDHTQDKDEFDMATINDLETAVSNVLSTAIADGTSSFGDTVKAILTVSQQNFNQLDQVNRTVTGLSGVAVSDVETGVTNVLNTAIGEGTTSFGQTIQAILSAVQQSHNQLVTLTERVTAIEARLNGG